MQNRPCSGPPKRKVPVRDSLVATKVAQGPTLTDWAYAAGFVDGEGCIAVPWTRVPSASLT